MKFVFKRNKEGVETLQYSENIKFVFVPRKVMYPYDFWSGNKSKNNRTFLYEDDCYSVYTGDLRDEIMKKLNDADYLGAINLFNNKNVFKY